MWLVMLLKCWFRSLLLLIWSEAGDNGDVDSGEGDGDGSSDDGDGDGAGDGDGDSSGDGEGDGDGDAGQDSGKKAGDRSQYIPRARFDAVNTKAQKLDSLVSMGVLTKGEDGELIVNQELLKSQAGKSAEGSAKDAENLANFRFEKDEVDKATWPIIEKIHKAYDYYDGIANRMAFTLMNFQAQLQSLEEHPETLQKDNPIKKLALEIIKNDPEFKTTYKGNPRKYYFAIKRAADKLAGKMTNPSKRKSKSRFIVNKSDMGGGEGKGKTINLSQMTKEQLDEAEKIEANRISTLKGKR